MLGEEEEEDGQKVVAVGEISAADKLSSTLTLTSTGQLRQPAPTRNHYGTLRHQLRQTPDRCVAGLSRALVSGSLPKSVIPTEESPT